MSKCGCAPCWLSAGCPLLQSLNCLLCHIRIKPGQHVQGAEERAQGRQAGKQAGRQVGGVTGGGSQSSAGGGWGCCWSRTHSPGCDMYYSSSQGAGHALAYTPRVLGGALKVAAAFVENMLAWVTCQHGLVVNCCGCGAAVGKLQPCSCKHLLDACMHASMNSTPVTVLIILLGA